MEKRSIDQKYRLEKLLQQSSGSFVYLGTDLKNNKKVIFKHLNPKNQKIENILRLKKEIQILLNISYPGIIQILDMGEFEGAPYLVTEYIEGQTLREALLKNKITTEKAILWTLALAETLNDLHQNLIIHLDLKPENIIVDSSGHLRILDFGLARLLTLNDYMEEKALVGSLAYMSPEQTGVFQHLIDARSDLYSLGIIFYELLAGVPPFQSQDAATLIKDHLEKDPPSLIEKNKNSSLQLEKIIFKLLSKNPADRYQTAEGLIYDLKLALRGMREKTAPQSFQLGTVDQVGKLMREIPLIGRNKVLNLLCSHVEEVKKNQGGITFLTGPGGIGKTRLLNELRSYATPFGCIVISGKGHSLLTRFPYAPLHQAIREYIQLYANFPKITQDRIKKALQVELQNLTGIVLKFVPELQLILDQPAESVPQLSPEKARERLFQCMNAFWKAIASVHPLILFLDDLHKTDYETLKMLRSLTHFLPHLSLRMIIAYRPLEITEWFKSFLNELDSFEQSTKIELTPLTKEDLVELCQKILIPPPPWMQELGKHIYTRSEGNPLYVTYIFRTLLKKRILCFEKNQWQLNETELLKTPFPEEILSFFIERLERVRPSTRAILRLAAAMGEDWTRDLLLQVHLKPEEIDQSLEEAKKEQLIEESLFHRGTYNFLHDRIEEAITQSIPDQEKQTIHQRVGAAIEKRGDKDDPLTIFKLAHHFYYAKIPEKIVVYATQAAKLSALAYASQDALAYYNQALACMEKEDSDHKDEILEEKADLSLLTGTYDVGEKIYTDLLAKKISNMDRCRLYRKLAEVFFRKGDYAISIEKAEKALEALGTKMPSTAAGFIFSFLKILSVLFLQNHFPSYFFGRKKDSKDVKIFYEQIRIYRALSLTYWFVTPIKGFLSSQRYLAVANDVAQEKELTQASSVYCVYLSMTPFKKRAYAYGKKALALSEKNSDLLGMAHAYDCLGMFYYFNGYVDEAIEATEKSVQCCKRTGDLWELSNAAGFQALCFWAKGELRKALDQFTSVFNITTEIQDTSFSTKVLTWMSFLEGLLGNKTTALKYLHQAFEMKEKIKDSVGQTILYEVAAAVYLLYDDLEKAMEYGEKAMDLIRKFGIRISYVQGAPLTLAQAYLKVWREKKEVKIKEKLLKLKKDVLNAQKYPNHTGWALCVYGDMCATFGKQSKARQLYQKGIEVLQKSGFKFVLGQAYLSYAETFFGDDKTTAKKYFLLANSLFEHCEAHHYLKLMHVKYGSFLQPQELQRGLEQNHRLKTIIKISKYFSSIRYLPQLLEKMMDSVVEFFGAERGFVMLKDDSGKLQVRISRHADAVQTSDEFALSRKIISEVYTKNSGLVIIDAQVDPKFKTSDSVIKYGLRSVLCVPLKTEKETLGIIYLDNRIVTNLFSQEDLETLEVFAMEAAFAIQNALVFHELDDLNKSLEKKVAQRTAALQNANEDIKTKMADLNRANKKLKELDTLKNEFFGLCSHNLRNPLTTIQLCVKELLETPDQRDKLLGIVSLQTKKMLELTEQFLNVMKMDSGNFPLQYKNVSLTELMNNIYEETKIYAQDRQINLNFKVDELNDISCDPSRIREVIENLLSNALKFTLHQGTIDFKAKFIKEKGTEFVEISVSNTGKGITPDKLAHIFDRFQHSQTPEEKAEKGVGLGLYLCKKIVELHNGSIQVKSSSDKETTFTFRIPRKQVVPKPQIKIAA